MLGFESKETSCHGGTLGSTAEKGSYIGAAAEAIVVVEEEEEVYSECISSRHVGI